MRIAIVVDDEQIPEALGIEGACFAQDFINRKRHAEDRIVA